MVESSLRLGAEALQMLGVAVESTEDLLEGVRGNDYALVRDAATRDDSVNAPVKSGQVQEPQSDTHRK